MGRDRVLERLAAQNWASQRRIEQTAMKESTADLDEVRATVSQLVRADGLLLADDWIIPCSMKVVPGHIPKYGWKDVPLWITRGRPWPSRAVNGLSAPRAVASFARTYPELVRAFDALSSVLDRVTSGYWRTGNQLGRDQVRQTLYKILARNAAAPVLHAVAELRATAAPAWEVFPSAGAHIKGRTSLLTVVNNPSVVGAYRAEEREDRLWVMHRHLFLPPAA